jgi:hypothetical protein
MACERYSSLPATGDDYGEYLSALVVLVQEDLEDLAEVFLAPFYVEDYENWAEQIGTEPDNSASRKRYVAEFDFEAMHRIDSPDTIYALVASDALETLCASTLREEAGPAILDEDFADLVEDSLDRGDVIINQLFAFLDDNVEQFAIIAYSASGLLSGEEITLQGSLDMVRDGDQVIAASPIHLDLLMAAISLGVVRHAGLIIRCFTSEEHEATGLRKKLLYGWKITPEGLSGMTEAELFNAACTDSKGGPIPPEEAVTYVATDETKYLWASTSE